MKEVELLVALLAIIGIVGAIAQRLRVSLPILLVIAGMVISLVTSSTLVRLEPETVFFIFLPPLIYIDAFNTSWKDLRDVADFITLQAVGLVLVTVVGVASLIHSVVPGMPWAAAVVLGAIVSPTDAIVAAAIAKEIVLPRRVLNIIKGESLINDATGFSSLSICCSGYRDRYFFVVRCWYTVSLCRCWWNISWLSSRLDFIDIKDKT